jgi:hypothetical protein
MEIKISKKCTSDGDNQWVDLSFKKVGRLDDCFVYWLRGNFAVGLVGENSEITDVTYFFFWSLYILIRGLKVELGAQASGVTRRLALHNFFIL